MKSDTNSKAIIYARVSTEDQADNYSFDTQVAACQKYAQSNGMQVIDEYTEDISGITFNRPNKNEILARAKASEFNVLICYTIDRFARDFVPQYLLEAELRRNGVKIEYVMQQFDGTPMSDAFKDMLITFAKLERRMISERMTRGKVGKARSGKVPGLGRGKPKYGYDYVDGYYVINEEQARIILLVFHWYINERIGATSIAKRLTEMGVPTQLDTMPTNGVKNKPYGWWASVVVDSMLKDETYAGHYFYNKTIRVDGKSKKRPREEWIEISVPAIVDEATFGLAQRQRKKNKAASIRHTKNFYLMQYRMTCKQCGGTFGIGFTRNRQKTGYYYYYRCSGQNVHLQVDFTAHCKGYIRVELIDDLVWCAIKEFLKDPERIRTTLLSASQQPDNTAERLADVEKEITALRTQQGRLLDLYLDSRIDRDMLDQRQQTLQNRLDSFEEMHLQLIEQQRRVITPERIESILEAISRVRDGLDNATDKQKKAVMDMLEVTAVLDREAGTITLEGLLPSAEVRFAGSNGTSGSNGSSGAGSDDRIAIAADTSKRILLNCASVTSDTYWL
jgi:site-specific DNA recombinase